MEQHLAENEIGEAFRATSSVSMRDSASNRHVKNEFYYVEGPEFAAEVKIGFSGIRARIEKAAGAHPQM
ncbi:MAG TPA: hypothetical protein VK786_05585 [bacterium]|jgi:hypothetical protein|nr:hypothetical protein [bacterium]